MSSPSDSSEAADVSGVTDVDSAATAFENMLSSAHDDEHKNPPEPVEEGADAELDLTEDAEEQHDKPEEPAIDAPVSLNAEEKAKYAQLPKEAQQLIADVETRRNAQVQEATTKASHAQRTADERAAAADAQAKSTYAQQLDHFTKAFEPTPPDPQLAWQDPARFVAENAQYTALKAQHDNLMQQVQGLGTEARTNAQKAFVETRDRELLTIPEIANTESRQGYLDRVMATAQQLGFEQSELAASATAREIKAFATIADMRDKAEKYDKAMAKQMQVVRDSKARTNRPSAAPSQTQGRSRAFNEATQRLGQSGSIDDAADAFRAIF